MSTHFIEYGICHGEYFFGVEYIYLSIYTMLILNLMPLNIVFTSFGPQVEDFATNVTQREGNFYGFTKETVDSLLLTLLPPAGHKYKRIPLKQDSIDEDMDIEVLLLKCLLDALRENAGFQIPKVCTGWPSCLDLNCSRFSTLHSPQPTPHYIHTDCTFISHFKPDYTFIFCFKLQTIPLFSALNYSTQLQTCSLMPANSLMPS